MINTLLKVISAIKKSILVLFEFKNCKLGKNINLYSNIE